jgi:uncharacterized membrane protein (DUF373 family)
MTTENSLTMDRIGRIFEVVIVRAVQILLMIMTAAATTVLFSLLWRNLRSSALNYENVPELHHVLQRGFGGVLLVLLGLELLDTLKTYFTHHHIRAEVILVVALIAVGRHVIQLDFETVPAQSLAGLSALVLVLTTGLFLVKRVGSDHPVKPDAGEGRR